MYRNNADDLVLVRRFAEKKPDVGVTTRLYRGESGGMSVNEKRALALKFSSEKPSEIHLLKILVDPTVTLILTLPCNGIHEEFFVKDQ